MFELRENHPIINTKNKHYYNYISVYKFIYIMCGKLVILPYIIFCIMCNNFFANIYIVILSQVGHRK